MFFKHFAIMLQEQGKQLRTRSNKCKQKYSLFAVNKRKQLEQPTLKPINMSLEAVYQIWC